jgi:hypothetical protein
MAHSSTTGDNPGSRDTAAGALDEARAERLARAHGYPYPYPEHSYLYIDGVALPLFGHGIEGSGTDRDPLARAEIEVAGVRRRVLDHLDDLGAGDAGREKRVPLLAYGSNRAPVQLGRKYGHWREPVVIPVVHGWLAGFDVVDAARLAGYGAVAATIAASLGTTASVSVIWLTERQLDLMHATEGINEAVYGYGRLDGVELTLDGGGALSSVFAYVNRDGALLHRGSPVALAAVPARNRVFPALDQLGVLGLVRDRLEPGADLETFVLDHIDRRDLGLERSRSLSLDASRFDSPRFTLLLGRELVG